MSRKNWTKTSILLVNTKHAMLVTGSQIDDSFRVLSSLNQYFFLPELQ